MQMTHHIIYRCEKCKSKLISRNLFFYLNYENEIKVASSPTLAMEESKSSSLTGIIKETFCTNCNKDIQVFEIDLENSLYSCQDAVDLLKDSLIERRHFIEEKYKKSLKLHKLIKKRRFVLEIYNFLLENERYFKDLINNFTTDYELLEDKNYIKLEYLNHLIKTYDKTKYAISIRNNDFFISLNDVKIRKNTCPNCLKEISFIDENEICPLCGNRLFIDKVIYID
ncbi:MAG: hypothetical protein E7Z75_03005 [Methanobrevibacter olleyae]|uniref:Uncharacterized protein n=1 Tax=Methanobrevibacter olleyae TaxID=294671 RepID=A0A8T3VWS8_METOL|nr:hypothetical protein [Methanobrevibacter olleyae]